MMKKIYTIYKATNLINNKAYIGFDSNWPTRKGSHLRCAAKDGYTHIAFYNAIRKYGALNFQWEVIYQSTDGEHTLTIMEPFFINEFNSFLYADHSMGYNMTLGGEGSLGRVQLASSIEKIRDSQLGKLVPAAVCEKISKSKKGGKSTSGSFTEGHVPWNKDKSMDDSYKKSCSMAQQERFQQESERIKLCSAREKGRKTLQEKAKIKIVFPDEHIEIITPLEFSKKYNFNLRTVYWNIKKHENKKIVTGVLTGYTLISQS